jgi:hypothetical protein
MMSVFLVFQTGKMPIKDMFCDLQDGKKLLELLEGLTGNVLVRVCLCACVRPCWPACPACVYRVYVVCVVCIFISDLSHPTPPIHPSFTLPVNLFSSTSSPAQYPTPRQPSICYHDTNAIIGYQCPVVVCKAKLAPVQPSPYSFHMSLKIK